MKPALRLLLTLFTILCGTTISGASIQESHAGAVFEKTCVVFEGETPFSAEFVAPNKGGELFRVVDDVELADIQKTGAFKTTPGAFEGKQFVDNIDDATALQKRFSEFFGGNQTIIKGQTPQSVIDNASRIPFADIPKGTAITIPPKDLPLIKPKL